MEVSPKTSSDIKKSHSFVGPEFLALKFVAPEFVTPKKGIYKAVVTGLISTSLLWGLPASHAIELIELTEQELSEIRGKFITPNNDIIYFGLSMTTSYISPLENHTVAMDLTLNNLDTTNPNLQITTSGTLGTELVDAPDLPTPNLAVLQIDGSVQHIQVAGNRNDVQNGLSLNVININEIPEITDGTAAFDGKRTFQTDQGLITQFHNLDDSLGYTIQSQGNLIVQQLGAKQLLQSVTVNGDTHDIINNIALDIAFDTVTQSTGGPAINLSNLVGLF